MPESEKDNKYNSHFLKGDKGGLKNTGGLAIPYILNLKKNSRRLRKESTVSEVLLWNELRHDKLGVRFNRQKPLLEFIVDFYCPPLKLVIEVDGSSHNSEDAQEYDRNRQKLIEEYGVHFLRIDDLEVKKDIQNVLLKIRTTIEDLQNSLR